MGTDRITASSIQSLNNTFSRHSSFPGAEIASQRAVDGKAQARMNRCPGSRRTSRFSSRTLSMARTWEAVRRMRVMDDQWRTLTVLEGRGHARSDGRQEPNLKLVGPRMDNPARPALIDNASEQDFIKIQVILDAGFPEHIVQCARGRGQPGFRGWTICDILTGVIAYCRGFRGIGPWPPRKNESARTRRSRSASS